MSEGIPYADIIILALIAGFILLRLRSVLGQKIGHDAPPPLPKNPDAQQGDEPVVQLEKAIRAQLAEEEKGKEDELLGTIQESSVKEGIAAIKQADPSFSLKHFMEGARSAFEMVFDAFAKGDKQTFQMLLSPMLASVFTAEAEQRSKAENRTETTLVAIDSQEITSATVDKSSARIAMKFVSEQVTVIRGKDGSIVEGDPSQIERVEDEWVFERDITSRNPNWKIIET